MVSSQYNYFSRVAYRAGPPADTFERASMDSLDQRAVLCVAAGFAAGALLGAHLKGASWCPVPGAGRRGRGDGSSSCASSKEDFISRLGMLSLIHI